MLTWPWASIPRRRRRKGIQVCFPKIRNTCSYIYLYLYQEEDDQTATQSNYEFWQSKQTPVGSNNYLNSTTWNLVQVSVARLKFGETSETRNLAEHRQLWEWCESTLCSNQNGRRRPYFRFWEGKSWNNNKIKCNCLYLTLKSCLQTVAYPLLFLWSPNDMCVLLRVCIVAVLKRKGSGRSVDFK